MSSHIQEILFVLRKEALEIIPRTIERIQSNGYPVRVFASEGTEGHAALEHLALPPSSVLVISDRDDILTVAKDLGCETSPYTDLRHLKNTVAYFKYTNGTPLSAGDLDYMFCHILRHTPEDIGIVLDANGWTSVDKLIEQAGLQGIVIAKSTILELLAKNERNRFSISDDGTMVRANHGHSVPVDAELEPVTPSDVLYHSTTPLLAASIQEEGLVSRGRLYVHLTPNLEYAKMYGTDAIFSIDARKMAADGFSFFASGDSVICTQKVPKEYLSLMAAS